MINKSIGGYFELELNNLKSVFHENAIGLNTGRNALEYILKARAIQKMFIPYFTCDVLLEPLRKLKIPYEFYSINELLEPLFDFSDLEDNDGFLYTNYFGLKDSYIRELSIVCEQLVVDNAQAFYAKPINNIPTFYSPRKFFGVSDGAFLFCETKLKQVFERDVSYKRMSHLLIRKDLSAEEGYLDFVKNDELLKNQSIKLMSTLTKDILKTIDYKSGAKKRIENYRFLEVVLKSSNQLTLQLDQESVPMVYPYWPKDITLKKRLHDNKIYTACYWPNVKKSCGENSLEFRLACEVIYLPIDQRYRIKDMIKILNIINA